MKEQRKTGYYCRQCGTHQERETWCICGGYAVEMDEAAILQHRLANAGRQDMVRRDGSERYR